MLVKVKLEKFGRIEMRLKDDLLTCLSKKKKLMLRVSSATHPEFESQLYDWIPVIRKVNLPVSFLIIIAKAKKKCK